MSSRPDRTEAGEYYFTYINQVPDGDVLEILHAQLPDTVTLLSRVSDEKSRHRYAPGKWSIREVAGHVNDCERLFAFRAFWFARGLDGALPRLDESVAAGAAGSEARSLASHVEEFKVLRASTLALFDNLPDNAWARRGIASGHPFTVRALAYVAAGHLNHHTRLLRERYL